MVDGAEQSVHEVAGPGGRGVVRIVPHPAETSGELAARPLGAGPAALDAAATALLSAVPGRAVTGSPGLTRRLVAAGARLERTATALVRAPSAGSVPVPDPPPGVRVGPLVLEAGELVACWRSAYPPGHVDHEPRFEGDPGLVFLTDLLAGRLAGPLDDASGQAVDDTGPAGACAVTRPADAPWVTELFRCPGAPAGTGRALLARAAAAAADRGLPLGLTVTDGNGAVRLYRSLGFEPAERQLTVVLPEG